jgi:hypothetical protein
MRKMFLALCAAVSLLPIAPALAQDEPFSVAAGGLTLEAGDQIEIVSQDVYVSRQAVRLRYVLRNRTANVVTIPIRFPLLDRTPERHAFELRWPADFQTSVDGAPVTLEPQRRALLGTQDHSELLTRLGVPISHFDAGWESVQRALAALPREERSRLATMGLVEIFEPQGGPPQVSPRWTVRESWQWNQAIPAGRDLVVEHSYAPGLVGTVDVGVNSQAMRNSESGQADMRLYCVGDAFLAGVDRLAAPDAQGEYPAVAETRFTFLSGSGPVVGEYRLVVDRGDEATLASFCGEGARPIGPTQIELRRSNWRPEGDLRVLFLAPHVAN